MSEKQIMEQKIRDLESQLSCNSSPIGDWKIAKCMEYQMAGQELPYDIQELNSQRQAVRDQINELEEAIAALPEEDAE